jgi:hypothetical protein
MDGEPSVGGGHPLLASEAARCNDGSPVASISGAETIFLRGVSALSQLVYEL